MSKEIIARLNNGDLPVDFNWNRSPHPETIMPRKICPEPTGQQAQKVQIITEDLRDGLHGISEYPSVEEMINYVGVLSDFGISNITVGIYAGEKNKIDTSIKQLLSQIRDYYPKITPIVASLTTEASIN